MSERLSFRCNESRSKDVLASCDIVQIRRFSEELNPEQEGKADDCCESLLLTMTRSLELIYRRRGRGCRETNV